MKGTRLAIGSITALSALSAAAAGLVSAASLTRIAGEKLGFPAGLEWTFTAAVDIGAVAGAILWSVSRPRTGNRATGVRLNFACSIVSATGVGLDHASNAAAAPNDAWSYAAFFIGAFMPLLSTWLVHGLSKIVHGGDKVEPAVRPRAQVERVEQSTPAPVKATATVTRTARTRTAAARTPSTKAITAKAGPPAVELTKRPVVEPVPAPVPAGLHVVPDGKARPAIDVATEWAREHSDADWQAVKAATGCSRSTAFRAISKAKEGDDAQLA